MKDKWNQLLGVEAKVSFLETLNPYFKWIDKLVNLDDKTVMQFTTAVLILLSIILVIKFYEFQTGKKLFEHNIIRKQMRKDENVFKKKKWQSFLKNLYATINYQKRKLGLDFTQDWKKDEIEYILQRNKKMSVTEDYMRYDEWSAIQIIRYFFLIIAVIIVFILMGKVFALITLGVGIIIIKWGILYIYGQNVKTENFKIMEEFGDFYLVQHHLLLSDTQRPFEKGLNIYKDIAKNTATKNFINIALYYIKRENGELGAIRKLKSLYRDIPSLQSLLIIEEQKVGGTSIINGNIEEDANGIRRQVIEEKERYIEDRALAIQKKVQILRWCVMVLIIQGIIIGAVAIIIPILGVRV